MAIPVHPHGFQVMEKDGKPTILVFRQAGRKVEPVGGFMFQSPAIGQDYDAEAIGEALCAALDAHRRQPE